MKELLTTDMILCHSIDANEMNGRLKVLYDSVLLSHRDTWWQQYEAQTDPDNGCYPSNPYFLAVQNSYCKAERRVMLIGQETYTWGGEFGDCGAFHPERSTEELMKLYDICTKQERIDTLLWRFGRAIGTASNSLVLFNNLVKIGLCGKPGFIPSIQPRILQQEVSITKPDVLIFTTGPRPQYMAELEKNGFSPTRRKPLVTVDGYCYAEIWEGLCKPAIWCDHPSYLNRQGVFNTVVDAISKIN